MSSPLGGVLTIIDTLSEPLHWGKYLLSLMHWVSSPLRIVLTFIDAMGELSTRGSTITDILGELSTGGGTYYH